MALPVLDGNQSATTLSSVLTGGEHIVAHTVVSLGSTAISNITSAVSGSVVSVSNFPATQTIAGTVTANNSTIDLFAAALEPEGTSDAAYAVRVQAKGDYPLPISGTVTANVPLSTDGYTNETGVRVIGVGFEGGLRVQGINPNTFSPENLETGGAIPVMGYENYPLPISGTVTANVPNADTFIKPIGTGGFGDTLEAEDDVSAEMCVAVHIRDQSGNVLGENKDFPISGSVTVGNSVTIGSMPNGALTTRFGTPTTASSAFATSAVTNTSRKYLLIQNVTTQSNVITVGIGFTPTTTQGIQLTAGAGITFESSYIPTGAVYVLSSVTASNFTILEA